MVGKRRRPGGNSLRRRQTESLTASPTTRDRHYDSLRTPRPSSRASVNENAGGGHQFYLASLSQRLQIEQYIVKTQTHLTKSTTDKADASTDASSNNYIECLGSPERSRTPSIGGYSNSSSNVGLKWSLSHLNQRRVRLYIVVSQSLTHVSKSTKHTLNRLGVFTVSSFHVYTCARSPSLLNRLLAGRSATRRRAVAVANSPSSRKSRRRAEPHHAGDGGEEQFRVNLPATARRADGHGPPKGQHVGRREPFCAPPVCCFGCPFLFVLFL